MTRGLNVNELSCLLEKMFSENCNYIRGEECVILANGYVDTTEGTVVTSSTALKLVREKARHDAEKHRIAALKIAM